MRLQTDWLQMLKIWIRMTIWRTKVRLGSLYIDCIKSHRRSFIELRSFLQQPLVSRLKKFLDPFSFSCTLGLLPCLLHKAKWVQLINGKRLQVLKTSLFTTLLRVSFFCCHFSVIIKYIKFWSFKLLFFAKDWRNWTECFP